ncbi:hypothetical protein [Amycolatopsis sulphurea]|uniref:hypothetical protein n=1 Tax=Amycolatopsis sulphurea TaxID=76022 RepID=UPI001FE33363|nr:hypothetical protein [Amycolatopsis sulphurea]
MPHLPSAQEQLAALVRKPAGAADGFVDVLGEAPQAGLSTGLAQRLMGTALLPRVYERY